ncbi:hypothetical protein M0804_008519 [Polistes exclamans]|nr:hypothetical protein M0804_008519 [Polistes exclamans]
MLKIVIEFEEVSDHDPWNHETHRFLNSYLGICHLGIRTGPVPKNQEDAPAKLNEVDKFQNELEETWVNVRNTMDKNYNKLLEDPSISASFLNTFNELIEEVNKANERIIDNARDQVDNLHKSNGKAENNFNTWQDFVLDSWNAFQDKLWDQYEKFMENPKVQEIVREIENAMRTTKDILEVVIEDTRARIDAERSENADQVVEFEDSGLQEKAQDIWKRFKYQLREKYDKFINNPKVKEITEKFNKALDKSKQSLKNIISSIRKKRVTDSRSYNLEETQEPQVAGFKEKVQEAWNDLKNNLKEKAKAIWNNPTVKEVVEKGEQAAEQANKALRDAIENVRNEIDRIAKEAERLKENADTTSWKEKAEKVWNDFKKKVQEKSEEIRNNPKKTEVLEEPPNKSSVKENVEKVWNDFKRIITDKVDEILRDPKTKDILNKSEKIINDVQGNLKSFIESLRKAADDSSKDTDENSAKSAAATYLRNVKEAWDSFKKKIAATYKNVWEKQRVKTAVADSEHFLLRISYSIQDVVDSIRKELEKINTERL